MTETERSAEERRALWAEKAVAKHNEGFNCAQSVFMILAAQGGYPQAEAAKLMQSFGAGMAMGETCGAFTGAIAALGLLAAPVTPGNLEEKEAHARRVRAMAEKFRAACGALRCADMRPEDSEVRRAVCGGYIRAGVRIAAEELGL